MRVTNGFYFDNMHIGLLREKKRNDSFHCEKGPIEGYIYSKTVHKRPKNHFL